MKLHHSQTPTAIADNLILFEFPMKFTLLSNVCDIHHNRVKFEFPMKLHCSQTTDSSAGFYSEFEFPMKLHCSQTYFPLLDFLRSFEFPMKLHHSQTQFGRRLCLGSLSSLWNYTALKQTVEEIEKSGSLSSLWNYTALKRIVMLVRAVQVWVSYEITLLSNLKSTFKVKWSAATWKRVKEIKQRILTNQA